MNPNEPMPKEGEDNTNPPEDDPSAGKPDEPTPESGGTYELASTPEPASADSGEAMPAQIASAQAAVPESAGEPEQDHTKQTRVILTPSSETKPAKDTTKPGKKKRPEPTTFGGKLWHNWVKPIGIVVVIVVLLRSTIVDWNDVPTGSMEPEIQVGDRIIVNRLAYAFQFPLTGPTIGIPFTPLQWDNPLDGIPQIQWGEPDRGDIVTFWNPVTDVRMVKRIVAVPGDTISMRGGVMSINGETASYKDITTDPPRETRFFEQTPTGRQKTVTRPLEDLQESLLGETRVVQHIKTRWMQQMYLVQSPTGGRDTVPNEKLPELFANNRGLRVIARFVKGAPELNTADGQAAPVFKKVDYNALAAAIMKRYETGPTAKVLDSMGLAVKGHETMMDGKAVPFEYFNTRFKERGPQLSQDDKRVIAGFNKTLEVLHSAMMTSFGPIKLGEDEYFMVGDNRNNSQDSRYFGTVDRGEITGKAFAVAFSFRDNKYLQPAWSRWLSGLH